MQSIKDRLTDNGLVMQLPIGREDTFRGLVDIISNKAIVYYDDLGKDIRYEEVPADLQALRDEYYQKLVEKVAEVDDVIMEKYLNGEEIDPIQLKQAIRKGTINCQLHPILCGSALKTKVFNHCWMQFVNIYPRQ